MRVAFWCSDKLHEPALGEAFVRGVRRYGDKGEIHRLSPEIKIGAYDVACMVGVKSRQLFHAHVAAGVPVIYFDKGYLRHRKEGGRDWEYWRTSVNRHTPSEWLGTAKMPSDRAVKQGLSYDGWKMDGEGIIFAGSSEKYHAFVGLEHPTEFAKHWIEKIRAVTDEKIIYRPKPSWHGATPIPGTTYSERPENLNWLLKTARLLITHGSNACYDAVCAGVPCIILGEAAAKSLSSTSIAELERPRLATDPERERWLSNIAYCQWTLEEMADGAAWRFLRGQL